MVFQRYTLFPHLTVGENIAFPLKVRRRLRRPRSMPRSKEMLKLVRLEGFEDRKPAQMSGGQQQRVALARALAYDPPVLLMDEPLSALDKKLREEIQHEIRRIHQQTEVTILYVTHDQEEALRLSDRIAVFSKGVIDQIGTGPELYANPRTRFVAEFIGDSDFVECRILERSGRARRYRHRLQRDPRRADAWAGQGRGSCGADAAAGTPFPDARTRWFRGRRQSRRHCYRRHLPWQQYSYSRCCRDQAKRSPCVCRSVTRPLPASTEAMRSRLASIPPARMSSAHRFRQARVLRIGAHGLISTEFTEDQIEKRLHMPRTCRVALYGK
jgi:energy-coupling factor transporter ATP-binding protein EcfA2